MSMKDMNIAKLTTVDLPLFNGIIQDLFPAVETPTIDYGKVRVINFRKCNYMSTTKKVITTKLSPWFSTLYLL